MVKKRTKRRKWVIILIPIMVIAVGALTAYWILINKLSAKQSDPKKAIVNAVIKDAVQHPTEIKQALESMTIKDSSGTIVASNNSSTTNSAAGTSTKGTASGSTAASGNNSTGSNSSMASNLAEMKENYQDYELLSTGAKYLGGSTYHLTAVVRYKKTGEVKTVELTTQLSESTKDMLRQYR